MPLDCVGHASPSTRGNAGRHSVTDWGAHSELRHSSQCCHCHWKCSLSHTANWKVDRMGCTALNRGTALRFCAAAGLWDFLWERSRSGGENWATTLLSPLGTAIKPYKALWSSSTGVNCTSWKSCRCCGTPDRICCTAHVSESEKCF